MFILKDVLLDWRWIGFHILWKTPTFLYYHFFTYFFAHEEPVSSVVYYLDTSYLMDWTLRVFHQVHPTQTVRCVSSTARSRIPAGTESSKEQPPWGTRQAESREGCGLRKCTGQKEGPRSSGSNELQAPSWPAYLQPSSLMQTSIRMPPVTVGPWGPGEHSWCCWGSQINRIFKPCI